MKPKRIQWVDYAKGIAILLVIIGHTIEKAILRGPIFSIHMPLFFILSGYTGKCPESREAFLARLKKSFVHMVIPAYVFYFLRLLLNALLFHKVYPLSSVLSGALYTSGTKYGNGAAFGMTWFLIVLFSVRILYDVLHAFLKTTQLTVVCAILSLAGVLIGNSMYLPFAADLTLAVIFLFHVGQLLKTVDLTKAKPSHYGILFGIWTVTLGVTFLVKRTYLEFAARQYPLFPVCYVTAAAGCVLAFLLIMRIEPYQKLEPVRRFFCFLGKNSMTLYLIHALDMVWYPVLTEHIPSIVVVLIVRLLIDLFLLFLVTMIQQKIHFAGKKEQVS